MIETTIRTDEHCVCISRENYRKSIENLCKIKQIELLVSKEKADGFTRVTIDEIEAIIGKVAEISVSEFMGGGANGKLV